MNELEGKVAVVTGAASGIGRASARLFVAEGARVVLADIQADYGAKVAEELGPAAVFVETDVRSEEDMAAAVATAVERFGRLDVMFNNAGKGHAEGMLQDLSPEVYRDAVDVLLGGVVFGMKHAIPVMKRQGSGSIINTASVAGLGVGYGGHMYSACKAAVIHVTRTVANEVAESSIRVNCIAPGGIPTAIVGRVFGLDQDASEALIPQLEAGFANLQPMPRSGQPEDIAEAALWLAGDSSTFVTGICLPVEGGLLTGKRWSDRMAEVRASVGQ